MKKRYTFTINSGDHKYPWINWKSDWMRPDLSWRQIVCELKWVSLDAYDCQQRSILSWPWMIPVKAERFLAIKLNESHHVLNQVFAWECTQLQLDFHMTTAQSCSVRCKVQKTLWCCIFSFLNQHIVGMFYTAMESRYETSPLFHGLCNLLGQRKERQHTHTHTHTVRGGAGEDDEGRAPQFRQSSMLVFHLAPGGHLAVWSYWPLSMGRGGWTRGRPQYQGPWGDTLGLRNMGERAEGERFPRRQESLVWSMAGAQEGLLKGD